MVGLSTMFVLTPLVFLCSEISAQRYLRSAVPLKDLNIDVKAEDNSRHGHGGSEEAERLKRHAPARLDDINVKVDAVDNSHHGASGGHVGGEEAERLKRHVPLNGINIGVKATDNSKHGGGQPIPRGPGPVVPSNPIGSDGKEEPASEGAGHDGPAIKGAEQTESQRLTRQPQRLDDINIDVKAVDNSHHGAGGRSGGEEAERLKRQVPLSAINVGVNAVDNSRHGAGRGSHGAGGQQPSGPVGHPEPESPASEEAERLKRHAVPLNAINIGINATDNSKHGGGRKAGPKVRPGPGPVKPSKPIGDSGSEEGPSGSSETEGPAGSDGAGRGGGCGGVNNNNNNNNNNGSKNNNNNNNNNNNCNGNNNNNNNNNRLKRQVPSRLDDINVNVHAVDNSRHGSGPGEHGGQEETEGEDAGRLARHG